MTSEAVSISRHIGEATDTPYSGVNAEVAASTYWRTLRHLRWSQLAYLALHRVLPRSRAPIRMNAPVSLRRIAGPWPFPDWQPEDSRAMIATRQFTFLHRTVPCNGSIPWDDRRHAKLWLYHLNYFDYLNVDFANPEEAAALAPASDIMLDWCAQNPRGDEVGWEPYPLSLRIVNWLKFLARHEAALEALEDPSKVETLLQSLGGQAATLERRLEKDLLGNHLVKNLKALLFAGALLATPHSARWWAKGERLLAGQLKEQILADGGHCERSPMYHAQVLEDLLDIQTLCAATGRELACTALLAQKTQAMAHFLRGILHPDGEIPLFNDSALGGARAPAELLARDELCGTGFQPVTSWAGSPCHDSVTIFPATGYAVTRSPARQSALIFDCGPLGPDCQPGHGHCDVLSYELSLDGQRVVVDSGVSTYDAGPERRYERSTAAHNTVRIDGEEQAEVWASFRVGRRPQVSRIESGHRDGIRYVSGEHDAYRRLGVTHARTIVLYPPDTWIVADHFRGRGEHRVESYLHFHPCVRLEPHEEPGVSGGYGRRWALAVAHGHYVFAAFGPGQCELEQGWYAERFGERRSCAVLRWTWQGNIPAGMIHAFAPAGVSMPRLAARWQENSIEIDGRIIPLR